MSRTRPAARQRARRIEQGLCPQHGTRPGPAGRCADCDLDDAIRTPTPVPAQRRPEGPPRSSCGDCGARIVLNGRAIEDGLCKLCREEAVALTAPFAPAAAPHNAGPVTAEQQTCSGRDGAVPCGRKPLPTRSVCGIHRVQELAGEVA
ncbi:hypothetical protein [Streptomyces acidicola]|uniref:hypothetical protein n=1 Tax=Streptomyces acidicola TaxID=2596892 RepID=UPI001D14E529|nr:hypothetical protein [Streptomyces acidicola]